MCRGFGLVVTKGGRYLWCEPTNGNNCEHSKILKRAGIVDSSELFTRSFVRVQYPDWKVGSFEFDEQSTLPGWVDEDEIKTKCNKILKRVAPALADYERVVAPAWADYEKVRAPAWADYEKARVAARADYEKVRDAAWADYQKVKAPARADYQKVMAAAWADYEKVRDAAWADYQKVKAPALADFIAAVSKFEGYVGEK